MGVGWGRIKAVDMNLMGCGFGRFQNGGGSVGWCVGGRRIKMVGINDNAEWRWETTKA